MKHSRVLAALAFPLLAALPVLAESAKMIMHPTIVIPPQPNALGKPTGIFPAQMRTTYGFDKLTNQGKGQIIGIVDAFDDPNIEADLGVFSKQFSLPPCTTANGCFKKVYASGTKPKTNNNWAAEISLDVEWAHAMAPQATIMLVEAASASNAHLYSAVDVAVQKGASVVSMSWGGNEYSTEVNDDVHFNVKGVTFLVASGDKGHAAYYPESSPFVVCVGGTTLHETNGVWQSETAWSGSGGGVSAYETEPSYQASAQNTGMRGVPDVAYDADNNTGVSIYISVGIYGLLGWVQIGGTSMAAPQWASMMAIANSERVAAGKSTLDQVQFELYKDAADLHDITSGTNGSCGAQCTASKGYDFVTGLGSPKANLLVPALVAIP